MNRVRLLAPFPKGLWPCPGTLLAPPSSSFCSSVGHPRAPRLFNRTHLADRENLYFSLLFALISLPYRLFRARSHPPPRRLSPAIRFIGICRQRPLEAAKNSAGNSKKVYPNLFILFFAFIPVSGTGGTLSLPNPGAPRSFSYCIPIGSVVPSYWFPIGDDEWRIRPTSGKAPSPS
jgi:hypothetical protein